ncbi:MAG: sugar transferase [bacterium]
MRITPAQNETIEAGAKQTTAAYSQWGKRLFDIVFVLLVLPVVLVPMAILFVLIAIDGGKPIFSHPRVGKDQKIFGCLKFRTMVRDADVRLKKLLEEDPLAAEEWATRFKLQDDPRITRIGRIIRKTSLDELPQLWNVLRGDMSLVGPRPVTEAEMPLYRHAAEAYYSVRPGVTGIWQVSGRNALNFDERAALDRRYAAKLSIFEDIRILALTLPAVVNRTGS